MSVSVECLPTEILQNIFAYCAVDDLKTISQVCHRWTDAVQFWLLKRSLLKVCKSKEEYNRSMSCWHIVMRMIDRTLLLASNRKYTGLEIAWRKGETDDHMRVLKELCDVCQDRFPVQRLLLRAPPGKRLVQFFDDRHDWLKNLTVFVLDFKEIGRTKALGSASCEILLPSLKKLLCIKSSDDANLQGGPHECSYVFTLNAPELSSLSVMTDDCKMNTDLESRYLEPDVCCLFLPTLKLKTTAKLEDVVMDGCADINQRHLDNSEWFLKNLQILVINRCSAEAAIQIWEKCSNLKDLIIKTYSNILHITPAMALLSLEKLFIEGCPLILDDQTVFPKLRYFCLDMRCADEEFDVEMHLIAPQLTTLIAVGLNSSQLIVHHKEQIRTMEVMLEHWNMETNPPPPNVTDLTLHWPYDLDPELNLVQDYLSYFPNIKRLKLYGNQELCLVDLTELEIVPDLQVFNAEQLTLQLTDLKKFAGLKSLVLSQCVIQAEPDDEEVALQALEYCHVDRIALDGWEGDRFPIRVDERQAPIVMVEGTVQGQYVFSSR